jgi:hypothetical protein
MSHDSNTITCTAHHLGTQPWEAQQQLHGLPLVVRPWGGYGRNTRFPGGDWDDYPSSPSLRRPEGIFPEHRLAALGHAVMCCLLGVGV